MKNKKTINIIISIIIIGILIYMPFSLKQICYDHATHPEWSLGSWNAVFLRAGLFSIILVILTAILLIINIIKKK
jgi:hypothetical protein